MKVNGNLFADSEKTQKFVMGMLQITTTLREFIVVILSETTRWKTFSKILNPVLEAATFMTVFPQKMVFQERQNLGRGFY